MHATAAHARGVCSVRARLAVAVLAVVARGRGAAAFGQQTVSGSTREQCLVGFQGLAKACGNAAAGHVAPPIARCDSGVCQQAVLAWWPKCRAVPTYSTLDSNNHHQVAHFYAACKQRSTPTCGACSGHASAKDTLSADKRVLTAGSPQSAAFKSLFVGEMANLLCVPSGQVRAARPPRRHLPPAAAPVCSCAAPAAAHTSIVDFSRS